MAVKHKGGEWVLSSPPASEIFTPEDFDETQREVARTVRDFVEKEILPAVPAMEEHDFSQNVRLLRELGTLGLAGPEIPEEYGGAGLDKITAAIVFDEMGRCGAFTATYGAHTGIGTLPIVYFGNDDQRAKYLPKLATAEMIAAYSLTESGAGSDALNVKTTAKLSPDGKHWILNGTKQWTTNAGIADLFTVYAKIDGEQMAAFIVERDAPGLSTGKEENKMGIRGSSTRSVILEDCTIPVENLLYEAGKGHYIAFNILNLGRFKLGAGTTGAARELLGIATRYAQERRQFDQPIASFALIQQKLAEMAIKVYAAESVVYRTAALFEEGTAGLDLHAPDAAEQSARALREYIVECSIMKVLGSEVLDYVVDEAVQIHGGYGFMEEFEVARAYRDSRINRIFEGTNEINRMLITRDLLRQAMKGTLPLMAALGSLQDELLALTPPLFDGTTPLEQERWLVDAARKIALMVAGLGAQKYQMALEQEQEFLAGIADLLIEIFAMESAILRAEKHPSDLRRDLAVAFAHEAFDRIEATARTLLASIDEGDSLRTQLSVLRKLTRRDPINAIALRRRIAQHVLEQGGYPV